MAYDMMLNVRGTRIKAGALNQQARLLTSIRQYPSLEAGTAEEIFGQEAHEPFVVQCVKILGQV